MSDGYGVMSNDNRVMSNGYGLMSDSYGVRCYAVPADVREGKAGTYDYYTNGSGGMSIAYEIMRNDYGVKSNGYGVRLDAALADVQGRAGRRGTKRKGDGVMSNGSGGVSIDYGVVSKRMVS
jgi:hypothetical protein